MVAVIPGSAPNTIPITTPRNDIIIFIIPNMIETSFYGKVMRNRTPNTSQINMENPTDMTPDVIMLFFVLSLSKRTFNRKILMMLAGRNVKTPSGKYKQ